MNTIRWDSYTPAELLRAVDNGQDVPVSALALAAHSVLNELDDANNNILALEDDVETLCAKLHKADVIIKSVRAMLEELQEELP